ncbi:MAG: L-2-hydroxyglutarate oxidase [Burkholderiales bacterium]
MLNRLESFGDRRLNCLTVLMYDYLIIGGGIVGCSVAWQLQQEKPAARIALLEKEAAWSAHQTGHNSGVVHAGIYYAPGSLKADFCRQGNAQTLAFCRQHGVPVQVTGKLLVATSAGELPRMQALYQRSQQLQLNATLIDADELHRLEPAIAGVGAIRVPSSAITDYPAITQKMAALFEQAGGHALRGVQVCALHERPDAITVQTSQGEFTTRHLVACAGIQADRIAAMSGLAADFAMLPFRGEYYRLHARHNTIVQHLIYPIPDPALPFLGVHLTRMIDGSVTVGPNAVLSLAREGYAKLAFNAQDTLDMLRFKGFWPLMRQHFKTSLPELKNSLYKRGYLALCQRYCPSLALADLQPMACGIRAQAVSANGQLIHDFLIKETARSLHLCNAPSPAATSAIPIGQHIVQRLLAKTSP